MTDPVAYVHYKEIELIHSSRTLVRGVALSAALLAGVFTSVGLLASPVLAAPAATKTSTSCTGGTCTKTTTFTLNCNTGIANGSVTVKTTQIYPQSVVHGTKFTIQWNSDTHIGGALASAAYTIAPGGTESGTITLDENVVSDAKGTYKGNEAGEWNISPPAPNQLTEQGTISSPSGFDVFTPVSGNNTTPSFTAGTTVGTGKIKVRAEDDNANVVIHNNQTGQNTNTTADCTPATTPPALIATINVT